MTEQSVNALTVACPRRRTVWTDALDRQLITLRWNRLSWDQITAVMGIGRNAVIERGRRLGAKRKAAEVAIAAEDLDRPSMRAGHDISWGVINAGLTTKLGPFVYESPLGLSGKGTPEERAARAAAAASR